MAITFGGLASGLDTNALIDGLMGVERQPLIRNQREQSSLQSARDTLSSFLSKVSKIKEAAAKLDTESEFASFSTSLSGDGLVASVTGTALGGKYSVNVDRLATETRTKSNGFADSTADLAMAGDLEITVGGSAPISVAVAAGDTLADVAAAINESDARVTASIIYDGTENRLLVRGKDTGAANEVTFNETGSVALGLSDPLNTYQNADDAQITVDDQFTITRSNNKFSDVIPGITLTATEVTASPITLEVEPDADEQAEKIQSFITAFNEAISAGKLAAGYGSIKASNENLQGDSSVRTALDRLSSTVSTPVSGISGRYNMLAAVGVELTQTGELSLDRTKLSAALEEDPESVVRIFTGDADAGIKGVMETLTSVVDGLTDGKDSLLETRIGAFESRISSLEEDELNLQRRLDDYESRLRKKFTQLELTIAQIQEQGSGLAGLTSLTNSTQQG